MLNDHKLLPNHITALNPDSVLGVTDTTLQVGPPWGSRLSRRTDVLEDGSRPGPDRMAEALKGF